MIISVERDPLTGRVRTTNQGETIYKNAGPKRAIHRSREAERTGFSLFVARINRASAWLPSFAKLSEKERERERNIGLATK